LTLQASGNVNIGSTSADTYRLDIRGNSGGNAEMLRLYNASADSNPHLRIQNDAQHFSMQVVGARSDNFEIADSTAGSSSAEVRLTIQAVTGNVGIGTTAPQARLHVKDSSGGANGTIWLGSATYYGTLQHDAGSTGANIYNVATASGGGHLFQRGGTTQMALDTSGNLGLGVTPSAWGSNFRAMDVGTYTSLAQSTSGYSRLANNCYNNNTNWIYRNTATATLYEAGGGSHVWYNAASGTAGNNISFTQAMTLNASGGLSVGNTIDLGAKTINLGLAVNPVGNLVGTLNFQGYTGSYGAGISSYVPTGSPGIDYQDLRFYTSAGPSNINVERARINSSGNLLVGTTSSSGLVSNNAGIVGGILNTLSGTNSITTSPTTVATLPSRDGATYIFTCANISDAGVTTYNCASIITQCTTALVATALSTASFASISVSGLDIRITSTLGTKTFTWSLVRIL
jgi:hypothetical protein